MHNVQLTTDQIKLIRAALDACAPIGGGSELNTLSIFIGMQSGVQSSEPLTRRCVREFTENLINVCNQTDQPFHLTLHQLAGIDLPPARIPPDAAPFTAC